MPKLIESIAGIAPTLATALGGPLAGAAAKFAVDALGIDSKKTADPVKALEEKVNSDPSAFLELKKIDADFQKFLKEKDIQLESIAAQDRDSARKREIEVKDRIPALLALGIVGFFLAIVTYILVYGVQPEGKDVLLIMLGSLGTAVSQVLNYYFGTTTSSSKKNEIILSQAAAKK